MSVAAEKVAEMLALSPEDRAFLARRLIASLDEMTDAEAETQWRDAIDRRSKEIEEGRVQCRPVENVIEEIKAKLDANRRSS